MPFLSAHDVLSAANRSKRIFHAGAPQLTFEEMRAGVEEAHKVGRKVAAQAYSVEAISNALEARVDSIEHGSFLDVKTAELLFSK